MRHIYTLCFCWDISSFGSFGFEKFWKSWKILKKLKNFEKVEKFSKSRKIEKFSKSWKIFKKLKNFQKQFSFHIHSACIPLHIQQNVLYHSRIHWSCIFYSHTMQYMGKLLRPITQKPHLFRYFWKAHVGLDDIIDLWSKFHEKL